MTTFSQIVDKMVAETKRPDMQTEIATYTNQTIRELHADPKTNSSIFFDSNLNETQITSATDTGQTWDIPKVSTFQAMKAVRFDSLTIPTMGYNGPCISQNDPNAYIYAEILKPGRGMNGRDHYCYRAQGTFAFSGYGGTGAIISLSWYEYPALLQYFAVANRPAQYDEFSGWTYGTDGLTPDQQTAAQAQVSNWILLRWPTLVEEGVRAKVYKRLSDDSRSRTSFSMYSAQRQLMYTAEGAVFA